MYMYQLITIYGSTFKYAYVCIHFQNIRTLI